MGEQELIAYLEERAGEYHRGTVRYVDEDLQVIYLRSDVEETRLTSQITKMVERIRPESSGKEERAFPFGKLNATVRLFQEAILIHFPQKQNSGIIVSLEPETARNLNTFLGECLENIHR